VSQTIWLPDRQSLLATVSERPADDDLPRLALIDLRDGVSIKPLLSEFGNYAISPDGQQLAFLPYKWLDDVSLYSDHVDP
jgi:hypothetical protein